MGLESGTYVNDLVVTNPVGATDYKQHGDDHLRLIKTVLKNTFPGMGGTLSRISTKSTNYTVLATDNTVLFNCTNSITLSITSAATLGNGFTFAVYANSADIVVDPTGSELINGATTITVPKGDIALIWCSGSAFYAAFTGPVMATALQLRHGSISSGATVDLGTVAGNAATVTHTSGTTAITSLGGASLKKGTIMMLVFSITGGTLSITHNATTLNLAGGANITLANGDVLLFMKNSDSSAEWKMIGGVPASRSPFASTYTVGSAVSMSSVTAVDFTGIPSGVTAVFLAFYAVSTNGTSPIIVQLGHSGGFETTSYSGASGKLLTPAVVAHGTGFGIQDVAVASDLYSGGMLLFKSNTGNHLWAEISLVSSATNVYVGSGAKTISGGELASIRITTAGGTNQFDYGYATVSYLR